MNAPPITMQPATAPVSTALRYSDQPDPIIAELEEQDHTVFWRGAMVWVTALGLYALYFWATYL